MYSYRFCVHIICISRTLSRALSEERMLRSVYSETEKRKTAYSTLRCWFISNDCTITKNEKKQNWNVISFSYGWLYRVSIMSSDDESTVVQSFCLSAITHISSHFIIIIINYYSCEWMNNFRIFIILARGSSMHRIRLLAFNEPLLNSYYSSFSILTEH